MKKLLVLLLLMVGVFAYSAEYLIYLSECSAYSSYLDGSNSSKFAIKYDTKKELYYFQFADYSTTDWIVLDGLDDFKNGLKKYLDWNEIAVEKCIKMEKYIPDTQIKTAVIWSSSDSYYGGKDLLLRFYFFGRANNANDLVIDTNKVVSTHNEYIDFKLENIYLTLAQVKSLLEGLSKASIEARKVEFEAKEKEKDLFK